MDGLNIPVILAGGHGSRFGYKLPKQFFKINNREVLYYSIKSFLEFLEDKKGVMLVVVPKKHAGRTKKILTKYFSHRQNQIDIVIGGTNRIFSQFNALRHIEKYYPNCRTIIVHDGARPLIKSADIEEIYSHYIKNNLDICFIKKPLKESLFQVTRCGVRGMDRTEFFTSQTPFFYTFTTMKELRSRYDKIYKNKNLHIDFHMLELLSKKSRKKTIEAVTIKNPNTKLTTLEDVSFIKKMLTN